MDLFDTCTWADFIMETTFWGTPTIHFPSLPLFFEKHSQGILGIKLSKLRSKL
jgi:hypothetical protein